MMISVKKVEEKHNMKIIPIKTEYDFKIKQHKMRSVAEHGDEEREISYYFDDKLVAKKTIPAGEYLTDDDFIRAIVEEYCKYHGGVYADIFNNHSDMVLLETKTVEVRVENYEVVIGVKIKREKNHYQVLMSANNGEDVITGDFKASTFSDVLEKLRIFINTLEGVSAELSQNIDELSNDKVLEWFEWE
jgi:hypothetical protein